MVEPVDLVQVNRAGNYYAVKMETVVELWVTVVDLVDLVVVLVVQEVVGGKVVKEKG